MQSKKDRWQEELFIASPLRDLIPQEHILKRVDGILDLSWLHDEVRECYCQDNGRPSIDPESALRLMLAGFFQGIVHDRVTCPATAGKSRGSMAAPNPNTVSHAP